jgi:hypothetical protein
MIVTRREIISRGTGFPKKSRVIFAVIARSEATKHSIVVVSIAELLRGACHRACIHTTRWLAMTISKLLSLCLAAFQSASTFRPHGAVARKYPHIRAIVFDLPRCEEAAILHLQRAGVSDRTSFTAGDFFEAIPNLADAIILKSVIHDWNDERSSVILLNCRRALPENGTLLLVERMMPEAPGTSAEDRVHAMSDLNMLRGPAVLSAPSSNMVTC